MTALPHDIASALAGQFTILREVGRGGMGVVYLARDDKLDRPVALKVLPADRRTPQRASASCAKDARRRASRTRTSSRSTAPTRWQGSLSSRWRTSTESPSPTACATVARGAQADALNLYWMGTARQLVARQVQVTLRRIPGEQPRTELTMTCDLRTGVRRNVRASQWFAGVIGSVSGFATGAIAAKTAGVLGAAVLGPVAGVGIGMTALTLAWYRWLCPGVFDKARREMLNALVAVAAVVRSEAVFGVLPRDSG